MCWAAQVKQDAVAGYAGLVELCEPSMDAREAGAAAVQARTGAAFVSPYNDAAVMAGQGTVALELLEQVRVNDYALLIKENLSVHTETLNSLTQFAAFWRCVWGDDVCKMAVVAGRHPAGPVHPSPWTKALTWNRLSHVGSKSAKRSTA